VREHPHGGFYRHRRRLRSPGVFHLRLYTHSVPEHPTRAQGPTWLTGQQYRTPRNHALANHAQDLRAEEEAGVAESGFVVSVTR